MKTSNLWFALCAYAWLGFLVFWFVSALKRKDAKKREAAHERLRQMLPMAATYILLFAALAHYGVLGTRFVPHSDALGLAGTAATLVGLGLAIWARVHLGRNWSAVVSIRVNHELIHSGPYRRIRHPIYTGMLLGLAGTAVALGEVRGILAFCIALAAFYFKARKEETYLTQEFGPSFADHVKRTGMFLPHFS
jgi:protein-S-isoprenylcysteine O-methyltransferase Ste14